MVYNSPVFDKPIELAILVTIASDQHAMVQLGLRAKVVVVQTQLVQLCIKNGKSITLPQTY